MAQKDLKQKVELLIASFLMVILKWNQDSEHSGYNEVHTSSSQCIIMLACVTTVMLHFSSTECEV